MGLRYPTAERGWEGGEDYGGSIVKTEYFLVIKLYYKEGRGFGSHLDLFDYIISIKGNL